MPRKQAPKRKAKEEEEEEQKIEKILEVRPIKRKREFRVKLKDQSDEIWLPENKVGASLIKAYEAQIEKEQEEARQRFEDSIKGYLAKHEENEKARHFTYEAPIEHHNCCLRCVERCLLTSLEVRDIKRAQEALETAIKMSKVEDKEKKVPSKHAKKQQKKSKMATTETMNDAIQIAAENDNIEIAEAILANFEGIQIINCFQYDLSPRMFDLFTKDQHFQWPNAIYTATRYGALQTIKLILTKCLQSDSEQKTKFGVTPLHLAAFTATDPDSLTSPLNDETTNAGAFATTDSSFNVYITPLHLAAMNPNPRIFKKLIDNGGDITVLDDFQWGPAHYSIMGPEGTHLDALVITPDKIKKEVADVKMKTESDEEEEDEEEEEEEERPKKRGKKTTAKKPTRRSSRNKSASEDEDDDYKSKAKVTKKGKKGTKKEEEEEEEEEKKEDAKSSGISGASPTLKYILQSYPSSIKTLNDIEEMAFQGHRYRNVEEYMHSVTVDANRITTYFLAAVRYGVTPVVIRMINENKISVEEDHLELALMNKRELIFDLLVTALGGNKVDPLLLHLAAKETCVDMAKLLVTKYDVPVNTLDEEENTPLHIAVSHGLRDLAAFLLSKGAKFDGVNIHGATVLLTGTRNGHRSCVQLLVENGVDVNTVITVKEEEQPAEAAAPAPKSEESDEETTDAVMTEAPPPEKKESTTVFHDLMRECNSEAGRLETAQYLINVGANIFALDSEERTPLDILVRDVPDSKISADVLDLLIKTAGNKAAEYVNKAWDGYTPLLFAAGSRKRHFCERLVEVPGINLNANVPVEEDTTVTPDANAGKSVLHLLVSLSIAPLVKRALQLGADPNKYLETSYPPIIDAASSNDMLLAFLEHKATNPSLQDKDGSTIVHKILQITGSTYNYNTHTYETASSIDKLLLILEKCPNINLSIQDSFGKTPLHYAAAAGQLMCVKTLLKKGVPIDTEDKYENTPLCCALLANQSDVVIFLIDAGAKFNRNMTTNPKQKEQNSPFGYPHKKKKRANRFTRTEEAPIKQSVFQYAVAQNNLSVMYCILESGKIDYTTALSDVIAIGKVNIAEELIASASAKMSKEVLASSQLLHSLFSIPPVQNTSKESLNKLISSLLAHKVPLNNQDKEGMTSLMHAIANHHEVEVIKHLMELGAKDNVKVANTKGLTSLHLAVLRNQYDIVELLLEYANTPEYINAQEHNGNTSLHYAILPYSFGTYANYPLISTLISNKASPVVKNKAGFTPAYLTGTLPAKTSDRIQKILRGSTILSKEETEFMEKEFLAGAASREKREKENHERRNNRMKSLTKSLDELNQKREAIKKKREEEAKQEQENRKKNASKYYVPIDECFWGDKSKHRVYVEGEDIYDVMLNQTDISHGTFGHNKYYVLQLIQTVQTEDKRTTLRRSKRTNLVPYKIINRWGRVGDSGKSQIQDYYSLEAAKASFTKKFQEKTKNKWENRANFEKFNGKYDLVERYYELKREKKEKTGKEVESKLAPAVQDLMSVITDLSGIRNYLTGQSLDVRRMPLGRLSHQQITGGYKILVKIEKNVKEINEIQKLRGQKKSKRQPEVSKLRKNIDEYSSEFYTLIPHDFGHRLPPPINSIEEIQTKTSMLDSMQDIEAASNLLSVDTSTQNALDVHYSNLGCDISEIPQSSEQFEVIKKYMENTRDSYNPKILNVYKVRRWEEVTRFDKHRHDNSVLLWHGSPTSNFCGILSQGLRIAPPEAPTTGYMFGKGIYFADAFAKSAGYCRSSYGQPACLLLCEVALGDCYERKYAEFIEKLPPGKGSTHGCGRKVPQEEGNYVTVKDTTIPLGALKDVQDDSRYLNYNEFIVYDISRVKIKYIVMVHL